MTGPYHTMDEVEYMIETLLDEGYSGSEVASAMEKIMPDSYRAAKLAGIDANSIAEQRGTIGRITGISSGIGRRS